MHTQRLHLGILAYLQHIHGFRASLEEKGRRNIWQRLQPLIIRCQKKISIRKLLLKYLSLILWFMSGVAQRLVCSCLFETKLLTVQNTWMFFVTPQKKFYQSPYIFLLLHLKSTTFCHVWQRLRNLMTFSENPLRYNPPQKNSSFCQEIVKQSPKNVPLSMCSLVYTPALFSLVSANVSPQVSESSSWAHAAAVILMWMQ